MPTRTELISCVVCRILRPLRVEFPSQVKAAAQRRCMSCANGLKNTKRAQPEPDDVVVGFLIAGTKVKANAVERMVAVAFLTDRKLTASAIATRLHCTRRTVERHRAKLAAA